MGLFENKGYMKTSRVGGFDKQDVLAYVDELNNKIFQLEKKIGELEETNENLRNTIAEYERKEKAADS